MAETEINIGTGGNGNGASNEPKIVDRTREPKGVQPKNAKMWLYIGAVCVLLLAAFFSSRTKPTNKARTDAPPQPVVQDTTADSAQQLKRDIDANKRQQEIDATNGVPGGQLGQPGHLVVTGFDAAGRPIYGLPGVNGAEQPVGQQPAPGTQPPQPPPPTAEETAAQQLAADERKRSDQARFSSNIAYSRSAEQQKAAGQAQEQASAQNPQSAAANAYTSQFQPSAAPAAVPAQARSRDEIPATDYKRPAEVNVNAAVGQPYVIHEGLSLDTVLMNRLDGDSVGPVKVLVSNPVYSHDHQHILIPEGTVVLGEARKIGATGIGQQRRIAVVFHRLLMPDGFSVDLDQFHGLNQIGEEALKDKVNNHYLEIFGTSIALGVITGAAEIQQGGNNVNSSGSQSFTNGAAAGVSQAGTNAFSQFLQIPPTITIREGHRVKVYFTQDMLVPAYENHRISQSF